MKIILKNNRNVKSKVVLFGNLHLFNARFNTNRHSLKEDWCDFTTDDGVDIYIDGISDKELQDKKGGLQTVFDITRNPCKITKFEVAGVNCKSDGHVDFYYYTVNCYGKKIFKLINMMFEPMQPEPWPVVLNCEETKIVLDGNASLLFMLESNSELHLDVEIISSFSSVEEANNTSKQSLNKT